MVVLCESLNVRLNKPDGVGLQGPIVLRLLMLLSEELLIENVAVHLSREGLLEVLLLHLVVVVVCTAATSSKVLVIFGVIEEVAMARIELKSVARCLSAHVMMVRLLLPIIA